MESLESVAKTDKTDRRAVIDQMRAKQKSAERRRGFTIVGVCIGVALLIVGAAAYSPIKNWWDLRQFNDIALEKVGAPASVCQDVTSKKVAGSQNHVPEGTEMVYADAPPAAEQQHWDQWDSKFDRKLYTDSDRPELGELAHNLEHGYTILWYDGTIADDDKQMTELRALARKLDADSNNDRTKFKAVPWTKEDDEAAKKKAEEEVPVDDPATKDTDESKDAPKAMTFPDGQHIAITHWSIGGAGEQDPEKIAGVWQYCEKVSGAALKDFMLEYPYMDSPEPNVSDRGKD